MKLLLASFLFLLLVAPALAQPQKVVVQSYSLLDFSLVGTDAARTVDLADMSVNLDCSDCAAVKGVDPPGTATLYHYEFETCDSSPFGSSNVSILTCASPGVPCFFIANASTGVTQTPGCVTISGPVSSTIDPAANKVVLLHTDTDQSATTRALAVRLYWREKKK